MNTEQFREWYQQLPLLTYGEITDEYICDSFRTILQWKKDQIFISDDIPEDKFTSNEYWLLLGMLYDCIDYGTSPRGAWLTDLGERVLDFLNSDKLIEFLEEE